MQLLHLLFNSETTRGIMAHWAFRGALTGVNLEKCLKLVESVITFKLNADDDVFVWGNNDKGKFSVQSIYVKRFNERGEGSTKMRVLEDKNAL